MCDAFDLNRVEGRFDAAFAGFLWSHISLDRRDDLLTSLGNRVEPGSIIVVADNRYVEGSNYAITRSDRLGNTYQRRRLRVGPNRELTIRFPDGTIHNTGPPTRRAA